METLRGLVGPFEDIVGLFLVCIGTGPKYETLRMEKGQG